MAKIRIKDLSNVARQAFFTESYWQKYEQEDARNTAIMKRLFTDTMNGTIKGFYLVSDKDFRAYHKSPKQADTIQYSVGFYRNGELFPCMDCQFKTVTDLFREGYQPGIYEIIA